MISTCAASLWLSLRGSVEHNKWGEKKFSWRDEVLGRFKELGVLNVGRPYGRGHTRLYTYGSTKQYCINQSYPGEVNLKFTLVTALSWFKRWGKTRSAPPAGTWCKANSILVLDTKMPKRVVLPIGSFQMDAPSSLDFTRLVFCI